MAKHRYASHVQSYHTTTGDLRYIVATWNEASGVWLAPMTTEARDATGCHTSYAKRLEDIDKANSYTYVRRRDALHRAAKLANPA